MPTLSQAVLLTVLLVCACALADGDFYEPYAPIIPDYVTALKRYDEAVNKVKSLAPALNEKLKIFDKKFHYGLFLLSLDYLSKSEWPGCGFYDRDYFEIVSRAVNKAWNNPQLVAKRLARTFKAVEFKIIRLRHLMVECKNFTARTCNKRIVDRGIATPEVTQLVEKLGKAAKIYLGKTYEKEAEDFTIIRALAKGKKEFHPLATALARARGELYPRGDLPCFEFDVFDE